MISAPLIQYYYTQFVGDAVSIPTIKATAGFQGIAMIDSDPYLSDGSNWYTNQNNFFRQVRNFVLDTTLMPVGAGTGIHWQVAQATSLQNIVFNMRTDGGSANAQQVRDCSAILWYILWTTNLTTVHRVSSWTTDLVAL